MKNTFAGILLFLPILLGSCSKSENTGASQPVTVIKDCTGHYLRQGAIDYPVCNRESIGKYKDGDSLKVAFKETSTCNTEGLYFCTMVHPYPVGHWVTVSRID